MEGKYPENKKHTYNKKSCFSIGKNNFEKSKSFPYLSEIICWN
jgi:hypothetical protein